MRFLSVNHEISCKTSEANHEKTRAARATGNSLSNATSQSLEGEGLHRRSVLLAGIAGSLYAAGPALGEPVQAPDLANCGPADLPAGATPTDCCPPNKSTIIDFVPPTVTTPLRVRPAAHLVDADYIAKYERAVALMKALPADDPRNFTQQANVHCAYCNGAYDQTGVLPAVELQVHNSWLFFPWHRFYLYFHERILGKLIGDDSFALPFWNYDAPGGMTMPAMYTKPSSPLYDSLRSAPHQPPAIVDLDFDVELDVSDQALINSNLSLMYRQMITNASTPELFLGAPYHAGDAPNPGPGSVEREPHGAVHVWTGDGTQPNGEDMGNFYSAARDPIFFAHHSNIDRLWYIWKQIDPATHKDFDDADWLDTTFLFYDEEARPVRVTLKDCLDNTKLGYTYQDLDLPWLNFPPVPKAPIPTAGAATTRLRAAAPQAAFPVVLSSAVSTVVKRPKVSRTDDDKAREEEVLEVYGIELDMEKCVKFDVFVDAPQYKGLGPAACELAGSFVNVPHKNEKKNSTTGEAAPVTAATNIRLALSTLLELRQSEDSEEILVTLVPKLGAGQVKVGGVRIAFSPKVTS